MRQDPLVPTRRRTSIWRGGGGIARHLWHRHAKIRWCCIAAGLVASGTVALWLRVPQAGVIDRERVVRGAICAPRVRSFFDGGLPPYNYLGR